MSIPGYKSSLTRAYRQVNEYIVGIVDAVVKENLGPGEVNDLLLSLTQSRKILAQHYNAFDKRVKNARSAGDFIKDSNKRDRYRKEIQAHIVSLNLNDLMDRYHKADERLKNLYYEYGFEDMPEDVIDPAALDDDNVSEFAESEPEPDPDHNVESPLPDAIASLIAPRVRNPMIDTPRMNTAAPIIDGDKTIVARHASNDPAHVRNDPVDSDDPNAVVIQDDVRPSKPIVMASQKEARNERSDRRNQRRGERRSESFDPKRDTRFPVPPFPVSNPFASDPTPARFESRHGGYTLHPRGQLFNDRRETPIMTGAGDNTQPDNVDRYSGGPFGKHVHVTVEPSRQRLDREQANHGDSTGERSTTGYSGVQSDPYFLAFANKQNEAFSKLTTLIGNLLDRSTQSATTPVPVTKSEEIVIEESIRTPEPVRDIKFDRPSLNSTDPAMKLPAEESMILKQLKVMFAQDARIKPMEVPVFSGNAEDFSSWWGVFKYTVHDNEGMNDLEKLMRLKAHTSGQALAMIKRQPELPKNYAVCVEILQKRYDRSIDARQRSMANLEELPMAKENATSLRDTLIAFEGEVMAIQDVEDCDKSTSLQRQFLMKFPERVREKMIVKIGRMKETWTMSKVFDMADELIREYEWKLNLTNHKPVPVTTLAATTTDFRNDRGRSSERNGYQKRNESRDRSFGRNKYVRENSAGRPDPRSSDDSGCGLCSKKGHHAIRCETIKDPAERRALVRYGRMCYLCLSKNHFSYQCDSPACIKCKMNHHVSLCLGVKDPVPSGTVRARTPFRDFDKTNSTSYNRNRSSSSFRETKGAQGST